MATNGNDGKVNFSSNPSIDPGVMGFMQGQAHKKSFQNDFFRDNGYLSTAIKELEMMKSKYEEIGNIVSKMKKTETKSFREKEQALRQQLKILNDIQDAEETTDTEAIAAIKETNKLRIAGLNQYKKMLDKIAKEDDENTKEYLDKLKEAEKEYARIKSNISDINSKLDYTGKVLSKSSDSFTLSLSKTLDNAGNRLEKLTNMFNLQTIANNSMEQNARSKASIMGNVSRQFGFTSNAQFESFKDSLNNTLKTMNKDMGDLFNSSDMKEYMANLSTYGITSTKLAQEQMQSSIIASKYFGVSAETQTEIFKYMKRTNNNEVLNKHNQTIVGIMRSQLGVSKEQLDEISKIAYVSTNDLAAVGMTQKAQDAYNQSSKVVTSALTSMLGNSESATAIQQLYASFLRASKTDLANWAPLLGGADINAIQEHGFNAETTHGQFNAFANFINAIQHSGAMSSDSALAKQISEMVPGYDANAINGIRNVDLSKLAEQSAKLFQNISQTTNEDVVRAIEQSQEATWLESISNKLDVWFNGINWKGTMNLANLAFTAYLASDTLKFIGNSINFFKEFKSAGGAKSISSITKALGSNAGTAAAGGILGTLGAIAGGVTAGVLALAGIQSIANKIYDKREQKTLNTANNIGKVNASSFGGNESASSLSSFFDVNEGKSNGTGFVTKVKNSGIAAIGKLGWGNSYEAKAVRAKKDGDWLTFNINSLKKAMNAPGQDSTFLKSVLAAYALALKEQGMLGYGIIGSAFGNDLSTGSDIKDFILGNRLDYTNISDAVSALYSNKLLPRDKSGNAWSGEITKDEFLNILGLSEDAYNNYVSNGHSIDGYHKNGLGYVSKDNYKALLHKGEMVLNAQEAAAYRGAFGIGGQSDELFKKGIAGRIVTGLPWVMTAGYGKYPTINRRHQGLDFGIGVGTPVGAAFAGTVDSITTTGGFGNSIYVRGNNGIYYRYAHLSSINVKPGQQVGAGEIIGLSGNTGNSTGPHLHFQTDYPRGNSNDIDPYGYVTSSLFGVPGETSKTSSTDTSTQMANIPVTTRRFIPPAFRNATEGQGGAEPIVKSVNGGFDKLISYLDSIREEQSAQRAIISAFSKSNVSESSF